MADSRFPRARCDHCRWLFLVHQVERYQMVRLADGASKVVTLCELCSISGTLAFQFIRMEK